MTTVKDVIQLFEEWVPTYLAESWDNVGLQLGSKQQKVEKLMIALDVTDRVVQEAAEKKVDFIIAHHPLLFKGLKSIDFDEPKGKVIKKLIQKNIAVYAAHTNLDAVKGGVNDLLAERLQIMDTKVLVPTHSEQLFKFAVYVPKTHATELMEKIGDAGAGHIGDYSHCTFQTEGMGAFKPLEGTNPFIGSQGSLEKVEEIKVETIIRESQLTQIVQVAAEAHPYEEMAYDLIPLANEAAPAGLGRIGKLKQPLSLKKYIDIVKKQLNVSYIRYTGDEEKVIETVAVLGGSGKGFIPEVLKQGADLYITGDLTFHEAQDAEEAGLCLIDPGHHVEEVMKQGVQHYFNQHLDSLSTQIKVITSDQSTDPFHYK